MTSVCVVGGGIAGLSTALTIERLAPDISVTLLEAGGHVGGKLRTMRGDGVQVEAGADSFIVRDEGFLELCRSLGIEDDLIEPAVFGGLVWLGGRLKRLPRGTVLGIPASAGAALRAGVLSPLGRVRALADLVLPGPLEGPDVSVGAFVRRRFGAEVLDRLVDPLLAGTRAGDPDRISLAAALPQIDAAARAGHSVMRGLGTPGGPPRFLSHREGMSRIVDALVDALDGVDLRTGAEADRLGPDGVHLAGGELVPADAVALCVPAPVAARLLASEAPEAARELAGISHASVASIALTFDAPVPAPEGSSGILIPSGSQRLLSAATWWTTKWPHASSEGTVIRCFVGRAGRHPGLDLSDDDLAAAAVNDLRVMVGEVPAPRAASVTRWNDGLPQYEIGHLDRIGRIEEALPPTVAVAGADYRGSGIPDCHRQGVAAARRLLGRIATTRR